jgi:hypothetical protein
MDPLVQLRPLLGPIGHVPPAEYEEAFYNRLEPQTEPAGSYVVDVRISVVGMLVCSMKLLQNGAPHRFLSSRESDESTWIYRRTVSVEYESQNTDSLAREL